MSETETKQKTVFGTEIEEQLRIETTGRVIRPWRRMLSPVANEFKINVSSEGLGVNVVDPVNVLMVQSKLNAESLETFDHSGDTVLGAGGGLGTVLQHARYSKSSDDPVTLTADDAYIQSEVSREIGGCEATVSERAEVIDPDSLRMEPDAPNLDQNVTVNLPPATFIESVDMMDTSDEIMIRCDGDRLDIKQATDTDARNVSLRVDADGSCQEWTHYSGSYLEDVANGLSNGYVDSLRLEWSQGFPIEAHFGRQDTYSGRYLLAPRIEA